MVVYYTLIPLSLSSVTLPFSPFYDFYNTANVIDCLPQSEKLPSPPLVNCVCIHGCRFSGRADLGEIFYFYFFIFFVLFLSLIICKKTK
jgi:hypothetical protein